jgi:hypothetical protein
MVNYGVLVFLVFPVASFVFQSLVLFVLQDFWWFARCVRSLGLSLLCIVVSTCVIHWLLLDGAAL